jgi:hypothetical protein
MNLLQICQWLQSTGPATALRESNFVFPILEGIHVLSIALIAGTVAIVDLRMLGLALKKEPVSQVAGQILPLTWAGFAVSVLTGTVLFASEAVKCYLSPSFRVKVLLLVFAGLNPLIFHSTVYRSVAEWGHAVRTPPRARLAAALSLTLWSGIVIAGRAIAYF